MIFEARGQFRDAEAAYRLAEQRKRAGMKGYWLEQNPPSESTLLHAIDLTVLSQGRMKARQGRLAEAEVDARRALLSQLKNQGKYNPRHAALHHGARRHSGRTGSLRGGREAGARGARDQPNGRCCRRCAITVQLLSQLGGILNLQRKGAMRLRSMRRSTRRSPIGSRSVGRCSNSTASRIYSLYASGQIEAGIAAAEQLVKKQIGRVGEKHFDTASARGTLAVGLMRAGREQRCDRGNSRRRSRS